MDHGEGDYCGADVDQVDMNKYPSLQDIPWWSAHLDAGDCMYIPYGLVVVLSIALHLSPSPFPSPSPSPSPSLSPSPLPPSLPLSPPPSLSLSLTHSLALSLCMSLCLRLSLYKTEHYLYTLTLN